MPAVRWEALKNEQVAQRFRTEAEQRLRTNRQAARGDTTQWSGLAGHLVEAAKVTCGLRSKSAENEWLIGKEDEDRAMRNNITAALNRKNTKLEEQRGGGCQWKRWKGRRRS